MLPSFFAAAVPQEKTTVSLYMSEIENYNAFPFFLGVLFGLLEWFFQGCITKYVSLYPR